MNVTGNDAPRKTRRLPSFGIGAFVGIAVWGIAVTGAETLDTFEGSFPKWIRDLDLVDVVGSLCMIIAYPIAVGGWALIWGDNGPPFRWIENFALNVIAGISISASLGAAMGYFISGLARLRWGRDRSEQ